jgi:hypothetical protein
VGAGVSVATRLAIALVRAWTRLYTCGLPPGLRTARRAEIDSDLWELEHDQEPPRQGWTAPQILARLLAGIPDDLAWRMDIITSPHRVAVSALAAAGMIAGPRRVSALSVSATMHVVGISAFIWMTSHGYLYWRTPGAMPQSGSSALEEPAAAEAGTLEFDPSGGGSSGEPSVDQLVAKLLEHRYSLSVVNGQLLGSGAPILQSALAQSQFVLLGENHGIAQTAQLGTAICNAGGSLAFRAMAIEEGPLVTAELAKWAAESGGVAKLTAFRSKFPDHLHIHGLREEFEMLQHCRRATRGEFDLWGLNESDLTHTQRPAPEEIRRREEVMKTRFTEQYARVASNLTDPPRVFLKFGALHIYRGLNPMGRRGIGSHVAAFAAKQGAQSLHIRLMAVRGGPPQRPFNLETDPRSQYLLPLLSSRLPSDWTLFDLRPLRQEFAALAGDVHPELETLVFGIDMLVLVPEGTPSTKIP